MEKQKLWTEHHQIDWDDTSPAGTLNLTGLNILLQRAAVEHAEHLGFGFQHTSKNNLSWVLIRLNIEINRLPKWREKVILTTWPKSMERISAVRDFVMYHEESDEVLCTASSEWLIIDLDTRRPQRMEIMSPFAKYLTNEPALTEDILKLNKKQAFQDLFKVTARYSSLDMNGHTNARKYIDWLDDAIYQVHGSVSCSKINMNYFHECKYGEELIVQVGQEDNKTIRGWNVNQNQPAFIASVAFE